MTLKKNISPVDEDTQLLALFKIDFRGFLNLARIRLICSLITSLCKIRSVNYSKLSLGFDGKAETAIKANVPVLPSALKIITKYAGKQDGLIPKISNQKMNAYLKEIADICNINKHLTWYVARHTFATTVALGNGVRIENLSAMMGHTNIKQTQHYAKVMDVNVKEDMDKLKARFS